jgi:hypothetical protein
MFCKNCGQNIESGQKFCKNCGQELKLGRFSILTQWFRHHRKGILIVIGIIVFLVIISIFSEDSSPKDSYSLPSSQSISVRQYSPAPPYNQEEITATVVNIFCPSTLPNEEASGGSGIIIDSEGLVLTNSHIIPQDSVNLHVGEEGCVVVLPDPKTGLPQDFYLAYPIVIPEISDEYDLAFMDIYAAYYDEELQSYAGIYPRQFPTFDDSTRCIEENVQLGEPIRIFGYPAISGGYSLTITDGVVSSFMGEGLITTSAKISHGNSGGLAVDENGCMIGIPSMVSSDEYESLGVIISNDLILEFAEELEIYMSQYLSEEPYESFWCNGEYWLPCPKGQNFHCPSVGDPICCMSDTMFCNNDCWIPCPAGQKFICPPVGDPYCL